MFGFLRGASSDADYRRAYARCCRYQRLCFGARTAPLVSYEGVFLYLLASEGLGKPPLPTSEPRCCRLQGAGKLAGADDHSLGHAAAAFGMLLAAFKLQDDVRDDRSIAASLALRWLGKPIQKSREYFQQLDPQAPSRFDQVVADHLSLEKSPRGVSLADYAQPTAKGFGYAFSLIARVDPGLEPVTDRLQKVGHALGAAIIAADCAADWRRDLRRGLPNPVKNAAQADAARRLAQRSLAQAGWTWDAAPTEQSIVLRTLSKAIARLDRPQAGEVTNKQSSRRRKSLRLARVGDCDCPCECGGCDGGGCDGGGCDGGGGGEGEASLVTCCCCDPCCFPCLWRGKDQQATGVSRKALRGGGSFVGRRGRANGDLDPTGLVVINRRSHPARTAGERIPGGAEVIVIEDGEFGVVVQRADGPS